MRRTRAALAVVLVLVLVSSGRGVPLPAAAADGLLERYAAGDFDGVVAEVARGVKLGDLLNQLEHVAPGWIAAAGSPVERDRRELAAATLALEAARMGVRESWRIHTPAQGAAGEYVSWKPPAKLLEWGCALWRAHEKWARRSRRARRTRGWRPRRAACLSLPCVALTCPRGSKACWMISGRPTSCTSGRRACPRAVCTHWTCA